MSELRSKTPIRRGVRLPDKTTWNAYRRTLPRRMCDQCREREGTVQKGRDLLCPTCVRKGHETYSSH